MTKLNEISAEPFIQWLFEERTLDEIKTSMVQTRAYIQNMKDEVKRLKKGQRFTGSEQSHNLTVKDNPSIPRKISLPEYHLGLALQAILTEHNFEFFADKAQAQVPSGGAQEEFFDQHSKAAKSHALVLELDSLEPMWRATRTRIMEYVRDASKMTEMDIEVTKEAESLAKVLRSLASEVMKLYTDAGASEVISQQAHKRVLGAKTEDTPDGSLTPEEVHMSHAYSSLLKDSKGKKIDKKAFVKEVSALIAKVPLAVRNQWLKAIETQGKGHTEYARHIGNTITPLVASLDVAFNAREVVHSMGHGFEPDYLLKTLDGKTIWGEFLGMPEEGSTASTHNNIKAEFKIMGYGSKGVFFYPSHTQKFPDREVLEALQAANVIGLDSQEGEYYVVVEGNKQFIKPTSANPAQA